jgi:hypothetical protein
MRSLRYRLAGRPAAFDDFLDQAVKLSPAQVELDIRTEDFVQEVQVLRQLIATFRWRFAGRELVHEAVCASVHQEYARTKGNRAAARANHRLQRMLERIEGKGIRVNGSEKRFEVCGFDHRIATDRLSGRRL